MISRRTAILVFAAGALLAGGLPAMAQSNHVSLIKRFDTDNDGTVDLAEAKKAASDLFDKLDRDHNGALDKVSYRGGCRPRSWPQPILITMAR